MEFNLFKKEEDFEKNFYMSLEETLLYQAIELISGRDAKRSIVKKKFKEDKIDYILSVNSLHEMVLKNLIDILKIDGTHNIEELKKLYSTNRTSALLCFFYAAAKDERWKKENFNQLFDIIELNNIQTTDKEIHIVREDNTIMNNEIITYIGTIELWNGYYNFSPKYIYNNSEKTILLNEHNMESFPVLGKIWLDKAQYKLEDQIIEKNYFAVTFSDEDIEENDRNDKITKKIDVKVKSIDILTLNDLNIFRVVPNLPDVSTVKEKSNQLYLPSNKYFKNEKVIVRYKDESGTFIYLAPLYVDYRENDDTFYVKSDIKESKHAKNSYTYEVINSAKVNGLDYFSDYIHAQTLYVFGDKLKEQEYNNMEAKDILKELVSAISPAYINNGKINIDDVVRAIDENNKGMFAPNNISTVILEKRKEDLITYLESLEYKGEFINEILEVVTKIIIESKNGGFNENKHIEKLIQEIAKKPETLRAIREYSFVDDEIKEKRIERESLKSEVETLINEQNKIKKENAKISEEQKLAAIDKISNEITKINSEKELLQNELDELRSTHASYKSLDEVINKSRQEESSFIAFNNRKEELSVKISELQKIYDKEKQKYENQLDEVIANKIMSQRANEGSSRIKRENEIAEYKNIVNSLNNLNSHFDEYFDFENHIVSCVQNVRNYEKDDIINIFACLYTGFITVFSGNPGTGKTSICNIIAITLGLDKLNTMLTDIQDVNVNRFVPISVERGWSTKRDFLGYFNPLTKEFDKNNKHLFDALSIQNYEIESEKEIYPIVILLDEANLSPMEYYWGDFMKIADSDNTVSNELNLGNDIVFKISKNLRFLATINNDHTTESLSPRLLDRSWIIQLPKADGGDSETDYNKITNLEPIPWNFISSYFENKYEDLIKKYIDEVYTEIIGKFEDCNITISRRSKLLMEKYIKNTQNIFDEDSLISLDYAILQKVIPTIVGNGLEFENSLQEISEYCNQKGLLKSNQAINEIIKKGKMNMSYFNYFS